jgi:DNA-binding PadR family transcriptional regulator
MIESGLIKANVDVETGENVYSLTSKGKKKQKTL